MDVWKKHGGLDKPLLMLYLCKWKPEVNVDNIDNIDEKWAIISII